MTLDISRHQNIMFQILKDIYTDTTIAPFLGFKGGTAAFMFYGLDRFSTDLDFDLLDESKVDNILLRIETIIQRFGAIKDSANKRFSLLSVLSYDDNSHNIKIEINRRPFGSRYEIKTFLGVSMLVMVREDMFANKLMALYERLGTTNRDIYDVHYFLRNNWPISREIVEQRSGTTFKTTLEKCISMIEKTPNRRILQGIGELLSIEKKSWAKSNLQTDTIFLLRIMHNNER